MGCAAAPESVKRSSANKRRPDLSPLRKTQEEEKRTDLRRTPRRVRSESKEPERSKNGRQPEKGPRKETVDALAWKHGSTWIEQLGLQGDMSMLRPNLDCLRSPGKAESLQTVAFHIRFSLAVITETHLLDEEVEKLAIPGYRVIDNYRGEVTTMEAK